MRERKEYWQCSQCILRYKTKTKNNSSKILDKLPMVQDTKHKIFVRTQGVLAAPPISFEIRNKIYVWDLKGVGDTTNYLWIQNNQILMRSLGILAAPPIPLEQAQSFLHMHLHPGLKSGLPPGCRCRPMHNSHSSCITISNLLICNDTHVNFIVAWSQWTLLSWWNLRWNLQVEFFGENCTNLFKVSLYHF